MIIEESKWWRDFNTPKAMRISFLIVAPVITVSQTFPLYDRILLFETTSDTSANVSIGDLKGDGNLDILLVNVRHWSLMSRVLLSDGRGYFPNAYPLRILRLITKQK